MTIGLRPVSRPAGIEIACPYCKNPMIRGSQPSHYLSCVEVTSAFAMVVKPRTGNKPGYAEKSREAEDMTTWTKVCSVAGCDAPVKRTGYCQKCHSKYMITWRQQAGVRLGKKSGKSVL